jgi:DNA mismatch repair protein MutS
MNAQSRSMAAYIEAKAARPEMIVFWRMGDFYEAFFEDAVTVASVLGIVLTKRGTHDGKPIPMCGVPAARIKEYLPLLGAAGHAVEVLDGDA